MAGDQLFDTPIEFKKLPGVLSFQRGLLVSDGLFYNVEDKAGETPLMVVRHGIRGTQNVISKKARSGDAAATADRGDPSNIQTTDTAKLSAQARVLRVRFSVRFLDLAQALFACAALDSEDMLASYRDSVTDFIQRAKDSSAVDEVARRIARNILNGRWLWRNRSIARDITVVVSTDDRGEQEVARAAALDVPLNHFDAYIKDEQALAALIAQGLRGEATATLYVVADLEFGVRGPLEVFPSQNYVENKPRGFARPLYALGTPERVRDSSGIEFSATRVMGQAAFRDQKISNALRTIDTWYADYESYGRPIAVEPNGASLDAQRFFRNARESAFAHARRFAFLQPESPDGLFMIASLVRGGVFSEKGDKEGA